MRTSPLLLVWLAACGGGAAAPVAGDAAARAPAAPAGPHRVVVFATRSLAAPFEALAARYRQRHPGAEVVLRCEGGAALLAAMNAGEPADVVAIGDSSLMSRFAAAAHLRSGSAAELGRNRLAIAVAAGNPLGVTGLVDLGRGGLRLAVGKRSASVGRYARWALANRGVECRPTVECDTADAVAAAVAAGAADAGLVYATTALAPGLQRLAIPAADNQPVLYSIAVARTAAEPRGAAAFQALALGAEGQRILREAGFLPIGAK